MWRWFAVVEGVRWFMRRVLPTLMLVAAAGMALWLALRWSAWWLPRLTALAAAAAGLGVALWLWRRWRWSVRMGLHRPALALGGLVLVALAGGAVYWLR
ncbi:hypothetical protein DQE82_26685 [Micromonospora sp. LHW51205]|uniref:hypothetical protein n=1 Tax=Micromonospora sp. LHW51205 TaxID=2248752 RepID=UPI000DE879BC|nr:hypothetical protein [Micromonospora sp. LHW51205]RBQ05139.1 hypothetical protein DQE82_26685 [Micromonospora sp. LHW51205]